MKNIILIASLIVISSISFAQINMDKEPEQTSKQTTIVFKSTVYDFGTVEYGDDATGEFVFKNVSKNPISITNVRASCGCTGTEWPREEIKKRKKGTITVTYDTKRVGKFHKNVYVYVDGNKTPIQLQVKGEVLPSKDGSKSPVKINSPKEVRIDGNVKSTKPDAKKQAQLKIALHPQKVKKEKEPVTKAKVEKKVEKKEKTETKSIEKQSVKSE